MNKLLPTSRRRTVSALAIAGLLGATSLATLTAFDHPTSAIAQTATMRAPAEGFGDLVEKVMPAVVSVEAKLGVQTSANIQGGDDETRAAQARNSPCPTFRRTARSASSSSSSRGAASAVSPSSSSARAAAAWPGLGLLHLRRRLCRHQQPCGDGRKRSHRRSPTTPNTRPRSSAPIPRPIWRCSRSTERALHLCQFGERSRASAIG